MSDISHLEWSPCLKSTICNFWESSVRLKINQPGVSTLYIHSQTCGISQICPTYPFMCVREVQGLIGQTEVPHSKTFRREDALLPVLFCIAAQWLRSYEAYSISTKNIKKKEVALTATYFLLTSATIITSDHSGSWK